MVAAHGIVAVRDGIYQTLEPSELRVFRDDLELAVFPQVLELPQLAGNKILGSLDLLG